MKLLEQDAVSVAKQLIGCKLYVKEPDGALVGGIIVETEAYNQGDAASHSYKGRTPRTEVMFGPAGLIYVYFTYGMHWCMNIVTGHRDQGEAVLIRSLKPDSGLEIMQKRRGNRPYAELTNGPAKVCQALGVTREDSGKKINESKFMLLESDANTQWRVKATERIGITKDAHRLWRFVAV